VTREPISPGPLTSTLLAAPGLLYGGLVRLRNRLYDRGLLRAQRLSCPVVAFGNLTVGGTGKTPLTSFAAAALAEAGYRVGIVSRGYRRAGGGAPLLVADGRQMLADAAHAGDEPWLLARDHPAAAGEVLLLDDAFQHRGVARDLDLLLVPAREPFGNGRILPFGPLREPLSGVARADAIVVTRGDGRCPAPLRAILERHNPQAPVFHATLRPSRFVSARGEPVDLGALAGFSAFAFSGIARPEGFESDLAAAGVRVAGARRYPDHHPYRADELAAIAAAARGAGAEVLVTTEKDLVRIPAMPEGAPPLFALSLAVSFGGDGDLVGFLLDRLRGAGAPGRAPVTRR
jgi:tetraacyldisaccharide 4'-kinase